MKFFQTPYFLISTGLFALCLILMGTFAFPPLIRQLASVHSQSKELDQQITNRQADLQVLTQLNKNQTSLTTVYQQANVALPTEANRDFLLLQLDGLLSNLNLAQANTTVPFAPTTAPDSSTSKNAKTSAVTNFTITGEMSFDSLKTLVDKLKTFGRWNQITSVSFDATANPAKATITSNVFWRPAPTADFSSTDVQFLTKAQQTMSQYQPYATLPDINREGSFNRTDPFAP